MELVNTQFVTDFTKNTLAQFGWAPGDAIPVAVGPRLLEIKQEAPPSKNADVLVARDVMTAEQIAEIEQMLAAAKKYGEQKTAEINAQRAHDEETKNMAPSVAEVYTKLKTEQPEIIDDRDAAVPVNTTPQPTPVADNAPTASVPESVSATFCPRCGWDMRLKFEVEPTARDKEDFLATLLGGTRYRKKYELFGGKVVVTFRSVLAEENKLIYRQLMYDQKNDVIRTEAEWFVQLMDYRMACSLESIADKTGKLIAAVPELDLRANKKDETALVEQLNAVNNNALAQETTRRLVGTHLRQFQRLVEAIEAMALEPSFWTGIE